MAIARLSSTTFKINLGFLAIETNWEIDELQKKAAWEMYVELATRITTVEIKDGEGSLRDSLSSLYVFFSITRSILKKYGPSIATPANQADTTFGHLAVAILNKVIRPTVAKWHPILLDWEHQKPLERSRLEHEKLWIFHNELQDELNEMRLKLIKYSNVLGEVSGVSSLI